MIIGGELVRFGGCSDDDDGPTRTVGRRGDDFIVGVGMRGEFVQRW